MLPKTITLTNWRNFISNQIHIPQKSSIIVDENGTGKTSILAALYSLFTAQPFPNTKFPDYLRNNQQYTGISTEYPDWFINGQVSPTGRLSIKRSLPQFDTKPLVLTYQPTDNYWFSMSRGQKLKILDDLLSQVYGQEYIELLEKLEKVIKGKTNLIKLFHDTGVKPDIILAQQLHTQSVDLSNKIWLIRNRFFEFLESKLPEFSNMIQSPLENWKVKVLKKGLLTDSFDVIWHRELAACKVLYGAQRDDFSIESNHLLVEKVLSSGEMRLLVLFIKNSGKALIAHQDIFVLWLLDDVFNELDAVRENLIFEKILTGTDYFLATGTRNPYFDLPIFTVKNLTNPDLHGTF